MRKPAAGEKRSIMVDASKSGAMSGKVSPSATRVAGEIDKRLDSTA